MSSGGFQVGGVAPAATVGVHGLCTGALQVGGSAPMLLGGVAPGLLGSAGDERLPPDGGVAPVLLGGRKVLAGACPASG